MRCVLCTVYCISSLLYYLYNNVLYARCCFTPGPGTIQLQSNRTVITRTEETKKKSIRYSTTSQTVHKLHRYIRNFGQVLFPVLVTFDFINVGDNEVKADLPDLWVLLQHLEDGEDRVEAEVLQQRLLADGGELGQPQPCVVQCSDPSVSQPVVQSRRRPLLGPSPG